MQRVRRFLFSVPTLHKILIGNSLVIVAGAIAGTAITKRFVEQSNFELAAIFVAAGITASIVVNYFILRAALHPVIMLRTTVDQVARGQTGVPRQLRTDGAGPYDRPAQKRDEVIRRGAV